MNISLIPDTVLLYSLLYKCQKVKKSPNRKVRGSLKSDPFLLAHAADKTCKDNIIYKMTDLFSRDAKVDPPL